MSRFTVCDLPLIGLKLVERQRIADSRGYLSRMYCAEELAIAGWCQPINQINITHTVLKGGVRGMHYQIPPNAEMKFVSCIQGEVWDVAVDVRAGSPTFLHWHAENLSAANNRSLLIPEGFAHGFQALTEDVTLLYFHSSPHSIERERALNPRDPRLAISWPLAITEISTRDANHPIIDLNFKGILL